MALTQTKKSGAKEGVNRMNNNEPETLDLFASIAVQPKGEAKKKQETVSKKETKSSSTSTHIIAKKNAQELTHVQEPEFSEPVKTIQPKESEPRSSRRKGPEKSDDAFKTISEVASQMNVPQHVLRFWETKFSQIKPMKRGGGRRYYRPRDVEIIKRIQYLLHNEGYTIKGVQKLAKKLPLAEFLNENSHMIDNALPVAQRPLRNQNANEPLAAILEGLKAIRAELNA